MKVCENCFADRELKGFISSSKLKGNCEICSSTDVSLMEKIELLDFFQELIDNFHKSENGESLKSKIQSDWSFFSTHGIATKILNEILPELSTEILSSDDKVDYTSDVNDNHLYWEVLKEKLKWSRRFLTDIEYLEDLGWDGFFNTQFELKPIDKLYRGRVHHKSGLLAYNSENMLCPKPNVVGGGRANPLGIPYLYLSDNSETVLYEVRASYLDELSIATFVLKSEYDKIKIVDFTEDTSLFQPTMVNKTIKAHLLRKKISKDLSKPMRRYDSEIEYIPTQFICEFIKVYTGASGIRFSSSLHLEGKNIVIFDQNLMECAEVSLKKVISLKLSANLIS